MAMRAYMMLSSVRIIQTPYFSLKRSSTSPGLYESGRSALKTVGGSNRTLGNMKRIVAVSPATVAAVNAVQARASQLNSRRVFPFSSDLGFAATSVLGAGLGGAATAGPGFCLSALDISVSGWIACDRLTRWRIIK